MIVRRCSQGHHIRLHRNTTKGSKRVKTYPDGKVETLTYPSSYDYFVDVDGKIVKKSNSFKVAEEYFVSECTKKHSDGHGRLIIGTHNLINGVATTQEEYPTMSLTKSKIKDFYDKRGISYSSSETKSELLSRIVINVEASNTKHIRK